MKNLLKLSISLRNREIYLLLTVLSFARDWYGKSENRKVFLTFTYSLYYPLSSRWGLQRVTTVARVYAKSIGILTTMCTKIMIPNCSLSSSQISVSISSLCESHQYPILQDCILGILTNTQRVWLLLHIFLNRFSGQNFFSHWNTNVTNIFQVFLNVIKKE